MKLNVSVLVALAAASAVSAVAVAEPNLNIQLKISDDEDISKHVTPYSQPSTQSLSHLFNSLAGLGIKACLRDKSECQIGPTEDLPNPPQCCGACEGEALAGRCFGENYDDNGNYRPYKPPPEDSGFVKKVFKSEV